MIRYEARIWFEAGRTLFPSEIPAFRPAVGMRIAEAKAARTLIDGFARLADNWDGYVATSISSDVCSQAGRFIDMIEAAPDQTPIPEVSPTPSGTISFDWDIAGTHACIEIGTTRFSGFLRSARGTFLLEGAVTHLDQTIVALIRDFLSAPATPIITVTEFHPWVVRHDLVAA